MAYGYQNSSYRDKAIQRCYITYVCFHVIFFAIISICHYLCYNIINRFVIRSEVEPLSDSFHEALRYHLDTHFASSIDLCTLHCLIWAQPMVSRKSRLLNVTLALKIPSMTLVSKRVTALVALRLLRYVQFRSARSLNRLSTRKSNVWRAYIHC